MRGKTWAERPVNPSAVAGSMEPEALAETLLLMSTVAVLTLPGERVSTCSAVTRRLEYWRSGEPGSAALSM